MRTALVLGGGGARGCAHVGVLAVLEKNGIAVDLVVGTSMGAFVGALWAAGMPLDELGRVVARFPRYHLRPRRSRPRDVLEAMQAIIGENTFAFLRRPLVVVATDLRTGQPVMIKDGPVFRAVLASGTIPGFSRAVAWDGMLLADGGIIDSVPVWAAFASGADRVIAVNVSSGIDAAPLRRAYALSAAAARIGAGMPAGLRKAAGQWWQRVEPATLAHARRSLALAKTPPAVPGPAGPVVLLKPAVEGVHWYEYRRAPECIRLGAEAAEKALPDIRAMLALSV